MSVGTGCAVLLDFDCSAAFSGSRFWGELIKLQSLLIIDKDAFLFIFFCKLRYHFAVAALSSVVIFDAVDVAIMSL